ncbi:hypothetical protein E2562_021475 [Oryza meyeriana var. granulata]|uniref:Uncharacterized protein n=1 Tax=Oryza meyeriana var. granulata TaxID=110450 RepID=A0A6G1E1J5_9ORYZ|nr:hypothetical protein E2562_021475 [Oryza meyeriana var. granulata]
MVAEVVDNLDYLLGDVEAAQALLDVAHARMGENAARLADTIVLLLRLRAGFNAFADAEVVGDLEQLIGPFEAAIGRLFQQRRWLEQAVALLIVVRAAAANGRRPRRLPGVLPGRSRARLSHVGIAFHRIFVMVSAPILFHFSEMVLVLLRLFRS